MNKVSNNASGIVLQSPKQVSMVGKSAPTIQDKIKDLTNSTIAPSLAGSLKPVSSIQAAKDLRGNGSIVINRFA